MELTVDASTDVTVENKVDAVVVSKSTDAEISTDVKAEVKKNQWIIAGDDVYIVFGSYADQPQWYKDVLQNAVASSQLNTDVSDLTTAFTNFESGVNIQIGSINNDLDPLNPFSLAYSVQTNIARLDQNTAAISTIEVSKVDASGAYAVSETAIAAWSADPLGGGAWFDSKILTTSTEIDAVAQNVSNLSVSLNGTSASVLRHDEALIDTQVSNPLWVDDGIQTDPDIYGQARYITEARAKSSLTVNANGSIAGIVAESDGSVSAVNIHADIFKVSNSANDTGVAPFTVDITDPLNPVIIFNGTVSFTNVTDTTNVIMNGDNISLLTNDSGFTDDTALTTFVSTIYASDMSSLQNQIDRSITTWFLDGEPTLLNLPALDWIDDATKNIHLGDLYYDNLTGFSYRFKISATVYSWVRILDSDITAAIANAATAQSTADGKMSVWYDATGTVWNFSGASIGDLLVSGNNNVLYAADIDAPVLQTDWTEKRDTTNDANLALSLAKITDLEATRDGVVVIFYEISTTIPVGMSYGDYMVDTDSWSGTLYDVYRYEDIDGRSVGTLAWRLNTGETAKALSSSYRADILAGTAQATADGKITTFYQTAAPTAEGVGDIWIKTNESNHPYMWSGSAWVSMQDTTVADNIYTPSTTTIAGGKITTGTLLASAIKAGEVWVDGNIKSTSYSWNGGVPVGFGLFSGGEQDSGLSYNIVGGKIYGTTITSSNLLSSVDSGGIRYGDTVWDTAVRSLFSGTLSSIITSESIYGIAYGSVGSYYKRRICTLSPLVEVHIALYCSDTTTNSGPITTSLEYEVDLSGTWVPMGISISIKNTTSESNRSFGGAIFLPMPTTSLFRLRLNRASNPSATFTVIQTLLVKQITQ